MELLSDVVSFLLIILNIISTHHLTSAQFSQTSELIPSQQDDFEYPQGVKTDGGFRAKSSVLRQLVEDEENKALHIYEDEAYDICRRYVAIHESQKAIQINAPGQYVSGNSMPLGRIDESRSMGIDDDNDGLSQGSLTQREIRRIPNRQRGSSKNNVDDFDYGLSQETPTKPPRRRLEKKCIRRGGSCDARPHGCCSHTSCRCNLWGTNCRCMRVGILQQLIHG